MEITSFDEDTAANFKVKYEELKSQGITSLIIDLRNNGGGLVDETLKIADYIVPKGKDLLVTVDKDKNEKVEKSKEDVLITKKEEIPPQVEPEAKQEEFKMGKVSGNFSLAAIEGEENFASLDEILKLIVVSKKEEKKMLSYRWDQLNSLLVDENLGSYANDKIVTAFRFGGRARLNNLVCIITSAGLDIGSPCYAEHKKANHLEDTANV